MVFKEAVYLINEMKSKFAVPIHYGSIVGTKQDAIDFARLVHPEIKCEILMKEQEKKKMNIYKEFNGNESNKYQDRNYIKEEIKQIENEIIENIFSHSSKNGVIQKARLEYCDILDKLERVNR